MRARRGTNDAAGAQRTGINMAQKTVQWVIGQILADEELRARFLDAPRFCVRAAWFVPSSWRSRARGGASVVAETPHLWAPPQFVPPRRFASNRRNGVSGATCFNSPTSDGSAGISHDSSVATSLPRSLGENVHT
jgi:hypothetical protein